MQENLLSGDIPEGFSSLMSLRYLNLSSNAFSGHIPANYGFLRSLMVLSLSYNHVSGSIPPELGNCSSIWRHGENGIFCSGPLKKRKGLHRREKGINDEK